MAQGSLEDSLWLNRMARMGSEGSLPAYSSVAAGEMLNRQVGIRDQIRQGTFLRTVPPTLVEMEDMGEDLEADQPPPPGTNTVLLPPPPMTF